jgi:hypothetical protein
MALFIVLFLFDGKVAAAAVVSVSISGKRFTLSGNEWCVYGKQLMTNKL